MTLILTLALSLLLGGPGATGADTATPQNSSSTATSAEPLPQDETDARAHIIDIG
jgi:hypothetical protein